MRQACPEAREGLPSPLPLQSPLSFVPCLPRTVPLLLTSPPGKVGLAAGGLPGPVQGAPPMKAQTHFQGDAVPCGWVQGPLQLL